MSQNGMVLVSLFVDFQHNYSCMLEKEEQNIVSLWMFQSKEFMSRDMKSFICIKGLKQL